jgi:voltage-gated potassium channel
MRLSQKLKLFSRLLLPIALMGLTVLFGIFGYMFIEGYSFLEAIYMTTITIGGVGYGEVKPLGTGGRIFTIILIGINLGLFTYFITLVTRFFTDGEFIRSFKKQKMEKAIAGLKGHVIICGFGRNGKESANVLFRNNIPFVVVDDKLESKPEEDFEVTYFIRGDATQDEVLLEAGIANAHSLICCMPSDATNLFVVLTARQLNPTIIIVSRASQDSTVSKLKMAGATNVIMPEKVGGAQMATLVMLPDAVELLSLMSTNNNEQFRVTEIIAGRPVQLATLDLWRETGCTILGIRKPDKNYTLNPGPNEQVHPGDRVIVMGGETQLAEAKARLQ